ncbi:Loc1p ASCRUDRAFT_72413 [Ascoidea rubescens DSM 1968]|uniref:60S ribosomal subunit assembly/export protein LOC1 n=1 Tax=Ascoidea rubescens DSM 1968 TaxID=1344418 RepID=A0A1D2VAR1_9ASCO|nr:hypothetical protein ASCRUDRAFT_72413 [Ascoidea rubescens DSM 1968]ODV58742.1 hypothetical protein ASCRUDRAFT_72413 [Ascoidea rubescens DSM 1968]
MVYRSAKKQARKQDLTRSVNSDLKSDSQARNLLISKPIQTPKSNTPSVSKNKVKKDQSKVRLYGKNASKVPKSSLNSNKKHHSIQIDEKDLDIPTLNTALRPGGKIIKKGKKKGKKFISDNDTIVLNKIVKTIMDKNDLVNESKLEKAKRLEEIRDLRRKELEVKENEKINKLNDKKLQLKQKANLARTLRRKNSKLAKKQVANAHDDSKNTSGDIVKSKRKVEFV